MITVGLTGGIGAGKSFVAEILKAMGYPVFNSDVTAKQLSDHDPEIRAGLIALFGEEVYTPEGLNRPFLATKIFNDDAARETINQLIHPRVRAAFDDFCHSQKSPIVFNEAAILIETGAYKNFDRLVLVTAPEEIRVQRAVRRDQSNEKEVRQRIQKQASDEAKRKVANFEIINDGVQPLLKQVEAMIASLQA